MSRAGVVPSREEPDAVLAVVAQWYYLDDLPKTEIAERLGLSRFKVARLLTQAREEGVVTIQVRRPLGQDVVLSEQLRAALGIDSCVAVDVPPGGDTSEHGVRLVVARAAAALLPTFVQPGAVVGLAWSRGVEVMVDELVGLPRCELVQLCGGLPQSRGVKTTGNLMHRAAELCGQNPHVLHAPLVVDDAAAAATLRRERGVAETLAMADRLDVAVLAIGAWQEGCSTVWTAVDEDLRRAGQAAGAVTEVAGHLLDADGVLLTTPLTGMLINATYEQLLGTPRRLVLATGAGRAAAVVAAARGGLLGALVLPADLGREILAILDGGSVRPPAS